jgi:hypothetical protein
MSEKYIFIDSSLGLQPARPTLLENRVGLILLFSIRGEFGCGSQPKVISGLPSGTLRDYGDRESFAPRGQCHSLRRGGAHGKSGSSFARLSAARRTNFRIVFQVPLL